MKSFTAEWGPGPQVKKAFEAECGCTLNFVSVVDGVALLNRVKLEGKATKADVVLGLDTNLTAEAPARACSRRMASTAPRFTVPGGWTDDAFRAVRLWLFRRRLRHRDDQKSARRA